MKQLKHISDTEGLTIVYVDGLEKGSEEIVISFSDGNKIKMYHEQGCCESVRVEDVCGDLDDLVGGVVVSFDMVENRGEGDKPSEYSQSWTWTFYKIQTSKGHVTIRWLGESSGYYSEYVDIDDLNQKHEYSWMGNVKLDQGKE